MWLPALCATGYSEAGILAIVSAKRTERLLTLVMLLLSRHQGWTKDDLFREIEPYAQAPTPAAREKLFDRDKAALREQGIPIESFSEDLFFDNDNTTTRYRINAEDYRLPGMSFTPAEAVALTVSAGMWEEAALGAAASRALRKLYGRGVGDGMGSRLSIDARIRTNEPFWDELWHATTGRRTIRFRYRAASTGEERQRTVQPWGMGSRFGHWYLIGFDVERQAERWFRLTRMTAPPTMIEGDYSVPGSFTMAASLASLNAEKRSIGAQVAVRTGTCQILRTRPGASIAEGGSGWDTVAYSYSDEGTAAAEIASLGANARALSPESLVLEVQRRFSGAVQALRQDPPSFSFPDNPAPVQTGTNRTTEHRLLRLLALVPYLLNHPGVEVETAARDFGISPAQLIKDVELLFVSGPRFYPDGLIDIQLEDNRIQVSDPQGLGDPIRFDLDEVCALLVGLDALSALPGLPDSSAVLSARNKLRAAAGDSGRVDDSLATVIAEDDVTAALKCIRMGIETRRQLRLRYVVAARDEVTDRFVEPLRTFLQNDSWYLDAWCHDAQGRRNFRLDRIRNVELTDKPATYIPDDDNPPALFDPSGSDTLVVLILTPSAHWMAQSYAAERTVQLDDGRLVVEVRVASIAWLPGLVSSSAGDCVIAAPSGLREEAREFAELALRGYAAPMEA